MFASALLGPGNAGVLEMSEEDRPAVISLSFAGFELSFSQEEIDTHCNLAQQLTALGTTIVASSGDGGILCEDKTPSVEYVGACAGVLCGCSESS